MRVVVSKNAKRDLAQIFEYWADRANFEIADQIIDSILDRFALIARFPKIGHRSDQVSPDLLCVFAEKYVIYYRKLPRNVRVIRVIHSARDQGSAFRKG